MLAACSSDPADYTPRDPCAALAIAPIAPTAAQSDGVTAALALWRGRGVTAFDLAGSSGSASAAPLEIQFADAAATFHGVYDPPSNRVLINRDLTDPDMLGIVIAHELGHVFGLVHIPPATRASLMNPDNVITPPTDADRAALQTLWGSCP